MIPLIVARNTFREVSRDRMLAGVIAAGAVILLATQVLSPLALGEGRRLTTDLGLSAISTLGVLVVLLIGAGLVSKEIDRRSIYNLLSRPISRHAYLIGKWIGLSSALWVVAVSLGAALWTILAIRGWAGHGPAVAEAVYLEALELTVVTAVAVLFSAIASPVLSALFTLGIYITGQWSYDLRDFASHFPGALRTLTHLFADVVPNFPLFNMRTLAANGELTSPQHLVMATAYAGLYCACALALATAAFETRDFK